MPTSKVALVEVFYSIQGEGHHAGRAAVFVRLAGCPLACEFAPGVVCDTPYQKANLKVTLDELFNEIIPSLLPAEIDLRSLPRLKEQIGSHSLLELPMLIFTGGEPTSIPLFDELVDRANAAGFYTAIETNATTYRDGLCQLDWRCASPKDRVPQTSKALYHNHNPQSAQLNLKVCSVLARYPSEYRYVIGGPADPTPPHYAAQRHYVSPAVISDGSGTEWETGFPGFAPGALERCLEIVHADPWWRLSCQQHKFWVVR